MEPTTLKWFVTARGYGDAAWREVPYSRVESAAATYYASVDSEQKALRDGSVSTPQSLYLREDVMGRGAA